ncbi:unnamed protein product [Bemisia tabaci]|uniref:Condensin II complex subunit H2 N-terminal domain-containing protein n=1 Tax=Bemisia tabaci TaxID=7038 RepID=A0A9P0ACJ3_BEMTA|nr:unnamed protein product [Bemisia tabaci]
MAPEPLDIFEHELLFKATDISEHELLFKATNFTKLASVDMCQYLEAYMRNIRNLYHNSSAVKEINFAEAAMVIQNSSIIFAKNVDSIWARAMNIRLALSATMNVITEGSLNHSSGTQAVFGQGANPSAYILPVSAVMGKENLNSQINWEALLASRVPISFDFNVMDHVSDGNYTHVLVDTSDSSSLQNFPQDPPFELNKTSSSALPIQDSILQDPVADLIQPTSSSLTLQDSIFQDPVVEPTKPSSSILQTSPLSSQNSVQIDSPKLKKKKNILIKDK